MNGFADSSNLYSPCRRFFFSFFFSFFPNPQVRSSLAVGPWLHIEKYPIKCWSPRGELAGPFFFSNVFASLSSKKKILQSLCLVGERLRGQIFWWISTGFVIVHAGNVSDFYIFRDLMEISANNRICMGHFPLFWNREITVWFQNRVRQTLRLIIARAFSVLVFH